MAAFKAFWNSPVGPKTSHFWGPVANWGFVAAVSITHMIFCLCCWKISAFIYLANIPNIFMKKGLADMNKPPEMISGNMSAGLAPLLPLNVEIFLGICFVTFFISFLLLQQCVSIQHCSWDLHGWYNHVTIYYLRAMLQMRLFNSTNSPDGQRQRGKQLTCKQS